jgi:serine/threonine-protein kinase
VALAHVEENPAPPRTFNVHLGRALEGTILRALAKKPEERFASAADMAAALRSGTAPSGVAAARPAPPTSATQRIAVPQPPQAQARAAAAYAPSAVVPRRTARPRPQRGMGVLGLLLAMAGVLVALGVGFFGLATLSREGVAPPEPTPASPSATPRPTAVPKPVAVATDTPPPQPTNTPEPPPSPTPVPPTATPAPPTPTPLPPTATAVPTPRTVGVPQLRGKRLDEALAAVQAAGLTATVRGVNVNVDLYVVAGQSPDAGAAVAPGTTVSIMVGTGMTPVPDVAGRPPEQARQLLQQNSFRVNLVNRRDPRIAAGQVIGTNPNAGTLVPRGSDVELSISAGR